MGNLAFQDVDLLLNDIQRSAPNRELCGGISAPHSEVF